MSTRLGRKLLVVLLVVLVVLVVLLVDSLPLERWLLVLSLACAFVPFLFVGTAALHACEGQQFEVQ